MFERARFKLTVWYLLIIMLVSFSFSVAIYQVLNREVDRFSKIQRLRIERRLENQEFFPPESKFRIPRQIMDPELIEETKQRLLFILVAINTAILFLSGGFGYFLAGRTLKPIKQMVDEQNRFISDASHELRTPLTALKSSLEVNLRDKKLTLTNAKKVISDSIDEVNKLQLLSDELLQIIQYHKPNNQMAFEEISFIDIVKESIQRVEALAKKKSITIKTNVQECKLKGNKYSLSELLIILLDNAIKYSPYGSSVNLQTKKTDGIIVMTVQDEGIGIAEKDLSRIFDRFYRTDSARSKSTASGYGLGLSIAKEIVELHHGSISVESKLNKGTTFTIRVPIKHSS